MAVGIKGQYYFQFSLGGNKDFIDERDFKAFTLIEEAGNVLPTFMLSFETTDESVLPLLNEGNTLQVSFGKDNNSLVSTPLAVTGINSSRTGQNKRAVVVTGLYAAIPYLSSNRVNISGTLSGVEVINSTVSKYFKFDSNILKSSDSMKWIQHNISDRAHVNKLWMHSDVPNSFIGVGITSDGKFILKDIKKDIGQPYKWRFGKVNEDENRDIVIDGDPHVETKTGLINTWIGYGREKLVYEIESGIDTPTLETQSPIVALTNQMAKSSQVEARFASVGIINDNVHPNYWRAAMRNLTNLASFLNVSVTLSFHGNFKEVRVLDQVMYKEEDPTNVAQSSEFISGVYYVTKVSRTVQAGQFVTTCVINREAFNQVRTGL